MKRIFWACLVALTATSCEWLLGWELGERTHEAAWYVRNCSDEPLIVKSVGFLEARERIVPGDSVRLFIFMPEQVEFGAFYLYRSTTPGEEWSVELLSEDSLRVRQWRLAEREAAGKQFFREADWRFRSEPIAGSKSLKLVWVFDVASEELQPVE